MQDVTELIKEIVKDLEQELLDILRGQMLSGETSNGSLPEGWDLYDSGDFQASLSISGDLSVTDNVYYSDDIRTSLAKLNVKFDDAMEFNDANFDKAERLIADELERRLSKQVDDFLDASIT